METRTVECETVQQQNAGENLKLEVKRVIQASRQRVFDAWTRPEMIRQWFGPGNKVIKDASADARVGGAYRIAMDGESCDAKEGEIDMSRGSVVTGRYTRVEPYDVLAFTWKGDWDLEEETQVTITLKDVDGGTELTLVQERFMTQDSRDKHGMGWSGSLLKLERFVEGA